MLVSLVLFYKVSFLVAGISASYLSFLGKHLTARSTILEVFFLSQLALLGNLLSALVFDDHGHEALGILFSLVFFFIGRLVLLRIQINSTQKGNFMIGGYLFLLAFQYLLIGIFPRLDSHMNVGLFGDMVTASDFENMIIIMVGILFFIISKVLSKSINRRTLDLNILQVEKKSLFEEALFTIPLVISLYSLSFLYTLSFLLLPSLAIGNSFKSEKKASIYIVLVASISSVAGLFLSISFERVSTTSAQVLSLCLLILIAKFGKGRLF